MKIRTITCHDVNNYGAALQALALQAYLEKQGHDVQIIDYHSVYKSPYDISWKVPRNSRFYAMSKYLFFLKFFFGLRSYFRMRPTFKRIDAFKKFNAKYFHLTRRYTSFAELAANPPKADLYIAGSDQIWRTNLNNGKDPAFYLQFGSMEARRISYAASFGLPNITDGLNYIVKTYLSSFNDISVRESSGVEILKSLGLNGTQVLDPVFLLSKDEWLNLLGIKERKIKEPYVLVYDLNRGSMHSEKKEYVARFAARGLKIVAINDRRTTPFAQVNINDGSPVDFVNLIANAEMVLSDSFHATAFSCIMHTPFRVYFDMPQSVRISDYLSLLNLSHCMNSPVGDDYKYDWGDAQVLLDTQIKIAKDFLADNLRKASTK